MIQALFRLLAQVKLIQFSDAIQRRYFCALRSGFLRNLMKIVLAERKAILVSSAGICAGEIHAEKANALPEFYFVNS